MASRIKGVHQSILGHLRGIISPELERRKEVPLFKYINIWNDQIDDMITGKSYSFANPACFIEFVPNDAKPIGAGMVSYPDAEIKLHIVSMKLHEGSEMDENLEVFDIRDSVRDLFGNIDVSWCSFPQMNIDKLDYNHGNIYKYVLGYRTCFLDNKGSFLDPDGKVSNWGYLINPSINLNIFFGWISGKYYESNIDLPYFFGNENGEVYSFDGLETYYVTDSFGNSSTYANVVVYQEKVYLCLESNNDTFFDPAKWIEVEAWQSGKAYLLGDFVYYSSKIQKCTTANSDLEFTPSNWNQIIS